MAGISEVRPSPIAGTWYSGHAEQLRSQIDAFIMQAQLPVLEGEVIGLIAPHAGHRYSGRTAGYAFRCVKDFQRDLVAIVSPMHAYSPVPLLTSAHRAYETPLGMVKLDRDVLLELDQYLHKEENLGIASITEDNEHSLEIELPFLQRALSGEFQLLPVMVHSHSEEVAQSLGNALAEVLRDRSALLVASTDLSHFYPEQTANELDGEMLKQIAAFSPQGVLQAERDGIGFACGAVPVAAVLWAAQKLGANAVQILHRSHSGEETGDRSSVVGYGSAVILKRT